VLSIHQRLPVLSGTHAASIIICCWADKLGGALPRPGWWRVNLSRPVLHRCPHGARACLGGLVSAQSINSSRRRLPCFCGWW
jgi:hypothetical protein